MKSALSRSVLGRRVASAAVLGLAATSLSLGVASAATTIDLEGTVRSAGGAPLSGISVRVYDATENPYYVSPLASATTAADGTYQFDTLDFDGPVKVLFDDEAPFDVSTTSYYLTRWNGGSRYAAGANAITLTTDGDTKLDMTMAPAAMLVGTVTAQDGHTPDYFDLDLVNSDDEWGNWVESAATGNVFRIAVEPGTLRLGAYGSDKGPDATWNTLDDVNYVESWWQSADRMADATPINAAGGQTVTGLNLRLTNALAARQAPKVLGFAAVGRTLTATPGVWSRNASTEFSYTWMRGAAVVGTGASYTPTVADLGQRLSVVVRALNGTNVGQAASAQTDPVRWPADAKGRAKALKGHQVRFAVKIVSAHQKPVKGKVVVLRGTKVVHKAVKLVKGKAVILVKHQPKGKQSFTVLYKGNKVLSKAAKDFTVRVR